MTNVEILGFVSAFLTTFAFLPQVVQVVKTRDTASLSLAMYSILTLGIAGWLIYGIAQGDKAVIVANMITLLLSATILVIKIYNEFFANKTQNQVVEQINSQCQV